MTTIQVNGACIPDDNDDNDYDGDDVDDDDDEEALLERSIRDFDRRSVCIYNILLHMCIWLVYIVIARMLHHLLFTYSICILL